MSDLEVEKQKFKAIFQDEFLESLGPSTIYEVHLIFPVFHSFISGHATVDVVEYYSDRDQWDDSLVLPEIVFTGTVPNTEWKWAPEDLLANPSLKRRTFLFRCDDGLEYNDQIVKFSDAGIPENFINLAVARISELLIGHCYYDENDDEQLLFDLIARQPKSLRGAITQTCAKLLETTRAKWA
jgi:hypothetical protein